MMDELLILIGSMLALVLVSALLLAFVYAGHDDA